MFSGVHGSATHEQRPHLSVVSASSGEVLIGPALLSHVDGLTDFLSMLPGVFFNLLASIWLRPESDPPFDVLVDVFHEVLVFIARRPVELVEGLDGREVLVKGELGGFILMVLVHNTDHSRQHMAAHILRSQRRPPLAKAIVAIVDGATTPPSHVVHKGASSVGQHHTHT